MIDCVLCKYSTLDFHDAEAVFLRNVYCDKGHTTSYNVPFDELDKFKCEDYRVSVVSWGLTHMIYFMEIVLVIMVVYLILRCGGVV